MTSLSGYSNSSVFIFSRRSVVTDSASNKGGLSSGDVIAHEALEAYFSLSMSQTAAHQAVMDAGFPGLDLPSNNYNHQNRVQGVGDFVDVSRYSQGISDGRGSEQIKVTYLTPIPFESIDPRFVNLQTRNEVVRETGGRITEVNYVPRKPEN